MPDNLKSVLENLHDLAKAKGLRVRFWDESGRTCLVIALPEEAETHAHSSISGQKNEETV